MNSFINAPQQLRFDGKNFHIKRNWCILQHKINSMTERELIKLEGTIRKKMEEIKNQHVSLKDSGIGALMNSLKKVDEALYDKILPEYKKMVAEKNIFK
jgi:hypothetical protein